MPWCPVCKNEYKEGYEICADCGANLVASLDDVIEVDEGHNHDNIQDVASFARDEYVVGMELENTYADMLEGKEDFFLESTDRDEYKQHVKHEAFKPFVKAKDRAEEYKASAFALLLVGVGGIVFLFLCLCNIIPIGIVANFKSIGFITMLAIFVIFIIIGVKSLVEAKTISALSESEDELVASINDFFEKEYNREIIDGLALSEEDELLTEELKFFKREETIMKIIIDKFGEIDGALLDNRVEAIYNSIYGE